MARLALALATCCLFAGAAFGTKPLLEPVYHTKTPTYCLLAFGPTAKDHVWLVRDGDLLYVDRNGNGNLTEAGKKVAAEKKPDSNPEDVGYQFDVGELSVNGLVHKGLSVSFVPLKRYGEGSLGKRAEVKAALMREPKATAVSIGLDVSLPGIKAGGLGGRVQFYAGPIDLDAILQFADAPDQAPVIRFNEPLQITCYSQRPTLRVGAATELVFVIGSPGIGPGTFATIGYRDTVPADAKAVVELSLPSARRDGPPVKQTVAVTGRC
jgi:hypothetical protein